MKYKKWKVMCVIRNYDDGIKTVADKRLPCVSGYNAFIRRFYSFLRSVSISSFDNPVTSITVSLSKPFKINFSATFTIPSCI